MKPAPPAPAEDVTAPPSRTALVLAFATIYLVWGSTYLGIRVAVTTMPPFAMAAARFGLAGVLLFTWLKLRGTAWPQTRQWRDNAIVGTLLLLGGNGLVAWAEQFIPSGVTALIIGAGPIFVVLTEWAWPGGQRPTLLTFAALLLGMSGVAYLTFDPAQREGNALPPAALIAVLIACLSWSVGSIYSRHTKRAAPPPMAAALQMICGSVSLMLVGFATGDWQRLNVSAISAASWSAFVYLALIGSILGFSTFVWLLKHSTPARISTHTFVNPIVAVFLGWMILHEPVTGRTLIASAIIVSAVVLVNAQKTIAAPAPPPLRPPSATDA